jgi:FkbM family methyltransferase
MYAPIILFVYNRPDHVAKTLEALSQNHLISESELYVYCDGPKEDNPAVNKKIAEVRALVRQIDWVKKLHIVEHESNKGLADNIMEGVTTVVNLYGSVIVLEDDIITSTGFLTYMNDALNCYETDQRVMHISGFFPRVNTKLPETFFYNVTTCWGWATWKRAWDKIEANPSVLCQQLHQVGYDEYLYNGAQSNLLYQQLIANRSGTLKTWAVRWHTSVYINNGFCLHPYQSLTENIGHDFSGENSGSDNPYQHAQLTDKIAVNLIEIKAEKKAYIGIEKIYKPKFYNRIMPLGLKERIKTILDKKKRREYFEKRRLYATPRFLKGSAQLLEKPFHFVDAATFLHGFEEIFESEIYKFNSKTDQPYIIDCGSNIGLSVVYFKRLYPKARVVAFEPDENIAQTLKENIKSFEISAVEVNEKAIWINNDGIEFQQEGGFSGRIPKPGDKENIVKVPTQRLRDLLAEPVDFLKMDIEGAENDVLSDCGDRLKNIKHLFIEYHSHYQEKQQLHHILALLQENNFRYHIHEAYVRRSPFVSKELMTGMDLQLNIYAVQENNK